ncbi:hypothetical protein CcaCcLH18_03788 [Colletotrichum camelliae]|nr:hypothetical protein CcaCcLH18_03788 [Colletotrichum camelliae]
MSSTNIAPVSTNGWDVVFATTYENINSRLKDIWKDLTAKSTTLTNINAGIPEDNVSLSLTTSAWQLTQGGSGSIVSMILPIQTGKFKGLNSTYDLQGQSITIQLSLRWVPEPNRFYLSISNNYSAMVADLDTNKTVTKNIIQAFASGNVELSASSKISIGTKKSCWTISDPTSKTSFYAYTANDSVLEVYPYVVTRLVISPHSENTPVTVTSAGDISDPVNAGILKELISSKLDQNLREFEFVFATVDVVTQLAKTDSWAWLKPTTTEYAVAEPSIKPANDNCVLAILSMVNNRINKDPVSQVDINAIAPDCTSSLLISPEIFIQNMLLPGASKVFKGANKDDFTINESNMSITNKNTVKWADIKLDNNEIVALTVPKNNFQMALETDRINLSFTNLNYPITMLGATVGSTNIIFNGQFTLGLKSGTNGNQTLWFDIPSDQSHACNVSTSMTQEYYVAEEAISGISVALLMLGIGAKVATTIARKSAIRTLREAGQLRAGAAPSEIADALQQVLNRPGGGEVLAGDAAGAAARMVGQAATSARNANIWASVAQWSEAVSLLTGGVAGGISLEAERLEDAAHEHWEHTPAFTHFADLSISQYSFAGLKNWNVQRAGLVSSLQIGFTAKE